MCVSARGQHGSRPAQAAHALGCASMQAKRRRLQTLSGFGGVSDEALRKIITHLRAEPRLMEEVSRQSLYAAAMALMDEVGQTGELICETGPAFTWHHANPQALLQLLIQQSRPLANTFQPSC